jgi:2-polyprenyl-3-methyl-5-hydroxy-6-metoxy-1,4-benzoquinol methylase
MSAEINAEKAGAFAGQMIGLLNNSFLAYMFSVGHRTGLFDVMSGMPASTSQQIAQATHLNERYVREWLAAMTMAKVVDHDVAAKTYKLPPEHAGCLTRAAGPGNLAMMTQYVAEAGKVEDKLVDCFKNGGGIPYTAYTRFTQLQREESAMIFDAALINVTLPLVDGLTDKLKAGIDVLDVGCGAGHAVNLMAKAFPNSRFTGFDFSEEAITAAKKEAKEWNLGNVQFEVKDVVQIDGSRKWDFVTAFDTIHDQAQPQKVLKGIHSSLKPGSNFLMVDIAASSHLHENAEHPLAPLLYSISTLHCMTVSLAYNGVGLGNMWGEQRAQELLTEAGFSDIAVKKVEGDILNNYYVSRRA